MDKLQEVLKVVEAHRKEANAYLASILKDPSSKDSLIRYWYGVTDGLNELSKDIQEVLDNK